MKIILINYNVFVHDYRYRLDSAAQPPCYRLQPISSHIAGFKVSSVEERAKAIEEWHVEIDKILGVLINIFPQELRDTYFTTVVEQVRRSDKQQVNIALIINAF